MFQKFNVVIEPGEDGWFVVTVPGLPGCITQGKTIDEATKNAKEAIEAYLESNPNHQITLRASQVCVREVQVNV
ncbi:type II toxin-antitoxin system HicB family antitoxin [Methanospirillum stamsii]|uniref:HicB family protein n=1 Tax=Methanospirillum stamsii TaxID=1277351 RepID=A0A2V2MMU6_9EURY|nr:type II toxin-antitoxin system HicB family antitoxin [Methanospirillum stamsii]PWR69574.1 HicB family protein [Methanospirillum stamsii]